MVRAQRWSDAATCAQIGSVVGAIGGLIVGSLVLATTEGALAVGATGAPVTALVAAVYGFAVGLPGGPHRAGLQSELAPAQVRKAILAFTRESWVDGDLAPLRAVEAQHDAMPPSPHLSLSPRPRDERGAPASVLTGARSDPLAVHDRAAGLLLIRGAPGSGKTIWLWKLTRALLDRAAKDITFSIPVVLELGSWQPSHGELADFIGAELQRPPLSLARRVTRRLLDGNELTLLLDGLDEVPEAQQEHAVAAIDRFIKRQRALGHEPQVVLTCRLATEGDGAQAPPIPRHISWHVTLMPLTHAQVVNALEAQDAPALRQAADANPTLRRLLTTPLWWMVASRVFTRLDSVPSWAAEQDESSLSKALYDAYVGQTYSRNRRGAAVVPGASFLANALKLRRETVLYIDRLTPFWLPEPRIERSARIVSTLIAVVPAALLAAIAFASVLEALFFSKFAFMERASLIFMGACLVGLPTAYWGIRPSILVQDPPDLGWSALRFFRTIPLAGRLFARPAVGLGALMAAPTLLAASLNRDVELLDPRDIALLVAAAAFLAWVILTVDFALDQSRNVLPGLREVTSEPLQPLWRSAKLTCADILLRVSVGAFVGTGMAVLFAMVGREAGFGGALPPPELGAGAGVAYGLLINSWTRVPDFVRTAGTVAAARMHGRLPVPLRTVLHLSRARGIMYPSGGGYRFMHRTLQEYLATRELLTSSQVPLGFKLERAERASSSGFHGEALADIEDALRAEPKRAELHLMKALALVAAGDHEGAIETHAALARAAGSPAVRRLALSNEGMILLELDRADEARARLEEAVAAQPRWSKSALALLGILSLGRGEANTARKQFRAALRAGHGLERGIADIFDGLALTTLGRIQAGRRRVEEGLEVVSDDELKWIAAVLEKHLPGEPLNPAAVVRNLVVSAYAHG